MARIRFSNWRLSQIISHFQLERTASLHSLIGPEIEMEGRLRFNGVVRIEGKFKGQIETNDTLIIGSNAVVEARIKVGRLVAAGSLKGEVCATDCVELRNRAQVFALVKAPRMIIEPGALFQGEYQTITR